MDGSKSMIRQKMTNGGEIELTCTESVGGRRILNSPIPPPLSSSPPPPLKLSPFPPSSSPLPSSSSPPLQSPVSKRFSSRPGLEVEIKHGDKKLAVSGSYLKYLLCIKNLEINMYIFIQGVPKKRPLLPLPALQLETLTLLV